MGKTPHGTSDPDMEHSAIPLSASSNAMQNGIHACRMDRTVPHPVASIEQGMFSRRVESKAMEMQAMFGAHMGMRMQMESAILSRHQRLPGGIRSNFVGLSTLHNTDEDFGFEDVLDVPELRETMPVPTHTAMEARLKL